MTTEDQPVRMVKITNRGPIEYLEIPLPEGGGITVMRGGNGSGKSASLAVTQELATGVPAEEYDRRDGARAGTTEGLGVTVRLVRQRRRDEGDGLAVVALSGTDPSLLVDPGLKDPAKADASRIRTLVRLAGIELTAASFEAVGVDPEVARLADGHADPLEASQAVRRGLHAVARQVEDEAKGLRGRLDGMTAHLDEDIKDGETDQGVLDSALQGAQEALAEAKARRAAGLEREQAALEAQESLQGLDEVDVAAVNARVAETERALEDARVAHLRATEALAAAEQADHEAKVDQSAAMRIQQAREAAENAIAAGQLDFPDEDQVEQLEAARDDALAAIEHAVVLRQRAEMTNECDELAEQVERLESAAEAHREAAGQVDAVLSSTLGDGNLAAYDFTLDGGRLCVHTEARGETLFAELSMGERYAIALDLALLAVDPDAAMDALLVLRQEAWEGLDPSNRAKLDTIARERGVVILTAEATGGELRAEVFEQGAGGVF